MKTEKIRARATGSEHWGLPVVCDILNFGEMKEIMSLHHDTDAPVSLCFEPSEQLSCGWRLGRQAAGL